MSRENSERWINVILWTDDSVTPPVANVRFAYPAIYKFRLAVFYFVVIIHVSLSPKNKIFISVASCLFATSPTTSKRVK